MIREHGGAAAFRTLSAWVFAGMLCLGTEVMAAPPEMDDHVHLSLQGGASPFETVSYAARALGGGTVVVQSKMFPYSGALDNRVALFPASDMVELCAEVVANLEKAKGVDTSPAPFTGQWVLDLKCGDTQLIVDLWGDDTLPGGKEWAVLNSVISFVEKRLGPVYFRDLVTKEDQLGYLQVRTIPSLEVEVDGIPAGLNTPILAFELRPGAHTLRLSSATYGIDKKRRFEIKAGEYTNITVDFTGGNQSEPPIN